MSRQYLDLTHIRSDKEEGQPVRVYYDQLKTIQRSARNPNWAYLSLTGGEGLHVTESYQRVKDMVDSIRECPPPRLSYSFTTKYYGVDSSVESTHYVPVDAVERVIIHNDTKVVTLVLKSGDKLNTGMGFQDLKNTLIEVSF